MNLENQIRKMAMAAKKASREAALVSTRDKNIALRRMARALWDRRDYLIKENKKDLNAARRQGYAASLVDRLMLNEKRVQGMARCLRDTAGLKDPVGEVLQVIKRPNGLIIKKVRTPIGVIGIIYESRPNVTSDCAGLSLKSGNAVILKGGKEAAHSNKAVFTVLQGVLKGTNIPQDAVQLIPSVNRMGVNILLRLNDFVDLIIPRGGRGPDQVCRAKFSDPCG